VYVYESILSVWAFHWVAETPILPKHIWELIIDPHGFSPDPTLTGCGAWKFNEHVPGSHIVLDANRNYFQEIHLLADVNIDMIIDVDDIFIVIAAYGTRRGESGYNIRADIAAEWDVVDACDLQVVMGGGVYDIAVASMMLSRTVVEEEDCISMNVTVENQGDFRAVDLGVTLYANATQIGMQEIDGLNGGVSTVLTFMWNTTGWAKGKYNISVVVDTIPCETDTTDNTLTDGVVKIVIPGDVNADCIVDIFDLVIVAGAYGSTPGDPNWNSDADLNGEKSLTYLTWS